MSVPCTVGMLDRYQFAQAIPVALSFEWEPDTVMLDAATIATITTRAPITARNPTGIRVRTGHRSWVVTGATGCTSFATSLTSSLLMAAVLCDARVCTWNQVSPNGGGRAWTGQWP